MPSVLMSALDTSHKHQVPHLSDICARHITCQNNKVDAFRAVLSPKSTAPYFFYLVGSGHDLMRPLHTLLAVRLPQNIQHDAVGKIAIGQEEQRLSFCHLGSSPHQHYQACPCACIACEPGTNETALILHIFKADTAPGNVVLHPLEKQERHCLP